MKKLVKESLNEFIRSESQPGPAGKIEKAKELAILMLDNLGFGENDMTGKTPNWYISHGVIDESNERMFQLASDLCPGEEFELRDNQKFNMTMKPMKFPELIIYRNDVDETFELQFYYDTKNM